MKEEKIKPCPFCGSTRVQAGGVGPYYFVSCHLCKADGPLDKSRKQAIEAWNNAIRHSEVPGGE